MNYFSCSCVTTLYNNVSEINYIKKVTHEFCTMKDVSSATNVVIVFNMYERCCDI